MNGQKQDGRAAAATRTEVQYLGTTATIADAEALGVSIAWERSGVVALDRKGVIERIERLVYQAPRSWIEERLTMQMIERPRTSMWVKGHDGVKENEEADMRGKREVWVGAPAHLSWTRKAIRGLTYLETDKGLQMQWLKEIGKSKMQAVYVTGGRRKTQHISMHAHG